MKSNYINQLFRLLLLKHTKVMIKIIIIKNAVTISLPKEKAPLQDLRWRSPRQQSRNRSHQLLWKRPPPQRLQGTQMLLIFMQVQPNSKYVKFSQFIKILFHSLLNIFLFFASFSYGFFSVFFIPLIYISADDLYSSNLLFLHFKCTF